MSKPFREPYFTYEELVEVVTDNYRVEELPALESAACEPGERLWLIESAGEIWRVWRKGRGQRARWTMDSEHALEAEVRLRKRLAKTVLARLNTPERSRDYALEPGSEEDDLAALGELDRVWLSGARQVAFPLGPGMTDNPLVVDQMICHRISLIEAELARTKALRARNLEERCGSATQVAAEPGYNLTDAAHILAGRTDYEAWVRTGAARARDTIPVRRPCQPTGLSDNRAARLMTAACDTETVVADRAYPKPLPSELAAWHVYIDGLGHCIAVAVDGIYKPDGDPWDYMTVAPVRMVEQAGWTVHDGIVIARVPYATGIGAVECEDSDLEF